jgi:hypothetical protein
MFDTTNRESLFSFIVTLALIASFVILLETRVVTPNDGWIVNGFAILFTFWFAGSQHRAATTAALSAVSVPIQQPGLVTAPPSPVISDRGV